MNQTERVDLAAKFANFSEQWRPKIVAELNGQELKLVKVLGKFPWHSHADVDELFMGWRGQFQLEFRDRSVTIGPGQMIVVPRGVEHRPVAVEEAELLLFEPAGVRNTGDVIDAEFTAQNSERI